jgi:heme exporter protein A
MLLQVDDLSKYYAARPVFKHLSFSLDAGRIMLLSGANGAGKSTLLKIISGLIPASGGKLALRLEKKQTLAYMGQQTSMYPDLSAMENLAFWNSFYGFSDDAERVAAALERVRLGAQARNKAGKFSLGMLKRLELARLILLSPSLLLLDEPESGLDGSAQSLLIKEITAAAAQGAAVVWVSHAPGKLLSYAHMSAELGAAGQNKFSELRFFEPAKKHPPFDNFEPAAAVVC